MNTKHLIIVEDNPTGAFLLSEFFRLKGIKYKHFSTATDAVSFFDTPESDNYKAVLMDIKLPGMSGIEATKIIKTKKPNIQIFMQSAYVSSFNKEQAFESGASKFFEKPLKLNEILKSVEEVYNE
jgi:two-component system response regulator (stage 0 sporulation protein F)